MFDKKKKTAPSGMNPLHMAEKLAQSCVAENAVIPPDAFIDLFPSVMSDGSRLYRVWSSKKPGEFTLHPVSQLAQFAKKHDRIGVVLSQMHVAKSGAFVRRDTTGEGVEATLQNAFRDSAICPYEVDKSLIEDEIINQLKSEYVVGFSIMNEENRSAIMNDIREIINLGKVVRLFDRVLSLTRYTASVFARDIPERGPTRILGIEQFGSSLFVWFQSEMKGLAFPVISSIVDVSSLEAESYLSIEFSVFRDRIRSDPGIKTAFGAPQAIIAITDGQQASVSVNIQDIVRVASSVYLDGTQFIQQFGDHAYKIINDPCAALTGALLMEKDLGGWLYEFP